MSESQSLRRWTRRQLLALGNEKLDSLMHDSAGINASSRKQVSAMQIASLKAGDKRVDVSGAIVWVDPAGVQSYTARDGSKGQRIRVGIKDESGSTFLTLFGDAADLKLRTGKKLHITNGYVKEYNGKPQLNVGQYGQVNVE